MIPFGYGELRPASAGAQRLLLLAAAFNLAAVPIVVLGTRYAPALLGVDPTSASQRLYIDLFAWVIGCFGLGYGLAARDLSHHWPIVALGAFTKAGVVVVAFAYFFAGAAALPVVLLATGDALFAIAFVRLLARHALTPASQAGGRQ